MSNDISTMVNLIQTLSQNSQDDTDPNNVVLNRFQSPTELNQLGESVKVTKWTGPFTWASGAQAGFTRASFANSYFDGSTVFPNMPRFIPTSFGKGIMVEEPTINYVLNSDFMTTDSSPDPIFSDDLTNLNGQVWTMLPGTLNGSAALPSFSYGTNGATVLSGADAMLVAGSGNWKAMTSTVGGWAVALEFQITLKTGSTLQGNDGALYFYRDVNNWYRAVLANNNFYLQRYLNGVLTTLTSAAVSTEAVNTQYAINLSIDVNGVISSQLYLTNTGGTQLANISATDNSIPQGFQFAVSGDVGVSLKYATAWGPLPKGWSCNPAGSWSNVIGIGPSITSKGYNSLQIAHDLQSTNDTYASSPVASYGASLANTTWTLTFTASCTQSGLVTLSGQLGPMASGGLNSYLSNSVYVLNFAVANVPQVFTITGTFSSGETATSLMVMLRPPMAGGVTITYGSIQLENSAHATSHQRNDSTTSISSRAVEALTTSTIGFSPTAGTVNMWVLVNSNTQRQVSGQNPILFVIPNAGGYNCLEIFHSSGSATWNVKTTNNAGTSIYGPTFPDLSLGWHMFTMRWSSGACDVLVDGVVVSVVPSPVLSTSFGSTAYWGIASNGSSFSLDSVIQDITVFNRSLATSEVLAGYQSQAPLFTDSSTVLKLTLNGDLNITPITTFNWNQGGVYI